MVFRKSKYNTRRSYQRHRRIVYGSKKTGYGKAMVPTVPRGLQLKKHHFKQTYFLGSGSINISGGFTYNAGQGLLFGPSTIDASCAMTFKASDMPQWGAFASLFDTYRINKVVIKMVPQVNSLTAASTTSSSIGANGQFMSTVIDYDDNIALGSYSSLLEYENFKETPPYKMHKRAIVPSLSASVYKTSGTTIGYSQKKKQWIDASYGDVEHYGIKAYVPGNTNSVQQVWKVFIITYISFKQTR